MGASILRFDEIPEADWGSGVSTTPLVSKELGAGVLTSGITHFEPGAALPLHSHNCDESVCLIEGVGVCEVDGQFHELRPFDIAFVPAGIQHRFINRGQTRMRIYWNYPSGHVTRTIAETGEVIDDLTPPNK